MAYYYRDDGNNRYYNDVDPGDGNSWTLQDSDYIFIEKDPINWIKYREDLSIISNGQLYLKYGVSVSNISGDLSGFFVPDTFIGSSMFYLNGTLYIGEGTILPKGYEKLEMYNSRSDNYYAVFADGFTINALYTTRLILGGKVNIENGKYIKTISNASIIGGDLSQFINLTSFSGGVASSSINIDNALLSSISLTSPSNTNEELTSINISNAAKDVSITITDRLNLSEININDKVLVGSLKINNCAIHEIKFNFNGTSLNNALYNNKLLTKVSAKLFKNITDWANTFREDVLLTTIEINSPVTQSSFQSSTFQNCTSLVGGNGTAYSSSHTNSEYARNDMPGYPGYFSYTNTKLYEHKIYNQSDYYTIIYDRYATDKLDIKFIPKYFQTLDYWLQYNESTKEWVNIGNKLDISGPVNSNQILVAIPKIATASDMTVDVKLSSVPSNSCTLTGAGTYRVGDNVVITASPNEGYIFDKWEELINDTWVVLSYDRIFTLEKIGRNRDIRAVCVEYSPNIAAVLTLTNDGNGSTIGSGMYIKGRTVEAVAIPNKEYKFVKWTDESGNTVSASKLYSFVINEDTTLKANFAKDPYYNGGNSGTGGGEGNYDNTSDIMGGDNDKVSTSFGTGGFISVYVMNDKLDDFRNLLFGTSLKGIVESVYNTIGSLGGKFTDYILNFFKIPVTVESVGNKNFRMGWYATDSQYPYTNSAGIRKDFGTIHITPYWGNALDYKSKIQIYLPYIGYEYLDTSEVMGKDIRLYYNISLLDGSCVAQIYIDNNLKYQFNGNCALQIPISEANMAEVTQKALSLGASVITAGASAGAAASSLTAGNAMSNFDMPSTQKLASSELSKGNQMANKVGDSLQNAMFNIGGDVRRCSNLSGNLGIMSSQTPYIIISRPRLSMPDNYAHYHGYPSNITSKIGDLSGYTVVSSIHLEGLDATSSEIEELEGILKSGFVVK